MVLRIIHYSDGIANWCYNGGSMTDEIYSDMALERACKERFGFDVDVSKVILRDIEVSRVATATVFLTTKKQLLVYVHGQSRLLLGDIKKIVTRMGLKAEMYLPPKNRPHYFDEIGREKFRQVFPGLGAVT